MGLFDMMFRDAIRRSDAARRTRAKAKVPLTATQQLARIRKQERDQAAREELTRQGYTFRNGKWVREP